MSDTPIVIHPDKFQEDGDGLIWHPPPNTPDTHRDQNADPPRAGDPHIPPTVTIQAAAGPPQLDTTTGDPHTGAMIALVPTRPDAYALPIDGAEPAEALHVTLYYLGEATDIPTDIWDTLDVFVASLAQHLPPIQAHVFGAAIWNPTGDSPSVIVNIGDPPDAVASTFATLGAVHSVIADAVHGAMDMADEGSAWMAAVQLTPWVAHMCIAYPPGPPDSAVLTDYLLPATALVGPIELGVLRITRGSEAYDYPLTGGHGA